MRRAGWSACLWRGLAIVVLLSLSLVLYEFSLVRPYHSSIVCIQQVCPIIHCHTKRSPPCLVKSNLNAIHTSYRNSIDSPLSQESSHNLPKENLPRHNLPQKEQYNLPSDPPKNWSHKSSLNDMAKPVPNDYHVERKDTVRMQQGQYAQNNFKYVEFGDETNLELGRRIIQRRNEATAQDKFDKTDFKQGRRIIQSRTEVVGHSDHIQYPIHPIGIQNNDGRMQPGGRVDQVVPSRRKQRPRLRKLAVVKRNTTSLSRERLSMEIRWLSEQLLQLRGFKLAANKDLMTGRHFPPWKNSSEVVSHLEALRQVVKDTELSRRNWTQYSLNEDIGARSKFQQAKVQQFCSIHNISNRLPSTPDDLNDLFQHLLYDDEKRLIYCYVPKAGCGNMRRMMVILNGIVHPGEVYPKVQLKQIHSFRNLSTSDALYKLKNYYKFAIIRNPMERMLSAYRNKIETPYNHSNYHFPDKVKGYILRQFRKVEFWKWVEEGNQSVDIHPTFAEFLQFMLLYPPAYYNEHFKPVLNLCFPCAMHYDFYANFKSQDYDVYALMDYLGIPSAYYPHIILHNDTPTRSYLQEYYQALPVVLKAKLFQAFKTELQFYYALYPEERNMHLLL